MRTTLTIEDRIVRDLKQIAHQSGKPFKVVVNEILRAGLAAGQQKREPKRYRLRPTAMGNLRADIDLDKTLALADALEDEAVIRKLEQRK